MPKPYKLLIVLLSFFSSRISAQQITISGFVKDSITHFPISNATVTNVNAKKKGQTDTRGFFQLQVSPNDFVYTIANSYQPDTLTYSFLFHDTLTIFLSPSANLLPTVTVRTQYSRYQYDSIKRRTEFEANRGKTLKTVSGPGTSGFGLTVNLDRFFKNKYKTKNKDDRIFEMVEDAAYVDYRFSPHIVAYYTGFKGDELKAFMSRYTPDYNWLRQHSSIDDVLHYINDKLKDYRKTKGN